MKKYLFLIATFLFISAHPVFAEIEDFTEAKTHKSLAYLYEERAEEIHSVIKEHEKLTESQFFQRHSAAQTAMRNQRDSILVKARALYDDLKSASEYHKAQAKIEAQAEARAKEEAKPLTA